MHSAGLSVYLPSFEHRRRLHILHPDRDVATFDLISFHPPLSQT